MAKKIYSPKKVSVTIGGVPITGWADGDMLVVTYDTDEHSKHIGTGGEGRFIKSEDVSGVATFRLADYSEANAVMQAVQKAGVEVPITVTDKSSNADVFTTDAAVVRKTPDFQKGADAKMNEWPFLFIRGLIVHSGAGEA